MSAPRAFGTVQRAPGWSTMCQIATSASGRLAHECGGGGGGVRPASSPAITVTSTPSSRSRGMSPSQSIEKCGVDELVLGRQVEPDLEQLERVRLLGVEQREHLRVDDAAAGGEPLHVAPPEAGRGAERVGVVDEALAHVGDGLEAAVRVVREPGHVAPVVHAPAVDALEVHPEVAPLERHRRPATSLPGGYASSWCAQNRNGSIIGHCAPSGAVSTTESAMPPGYGRRTGRANRLGPVGWVPCGRGPGACPTRS